MISIKETIIVEGEYDKIKLQSIVDANILVTGGFRIFKDKEMQSLIRKLAQKDGIIIFTDSDKAGFLIRNFLKSTTAGETVYHAFIPEVKGKEKRKAVPGKEGILGVEGIKASVLLEALHNSGATLSDGTRKKKESITKLDLYRAGFYGKENSRQKREEFLKRNGLPTRISANMLVEVMNLLFDKKDLE